MGFFSKFFTNVKSTVVASVVSKEIDKLEQKMQASIMPLNNLFAKILDAYVIGINNTLNGSVKIVNVTKKDVTTIIVENYETLQKIKQLVESLNTTRNRQLLKSIVQNSVTILKQVNDDTETTIESFEENFKDNIKNFETIWK